jgi:hypothetical protein
MVLKKKWDEKQYNLHRSKVDNAKPSIDNKLSMRHIEFHLHLKKLRNEVEEKRRTKIENENRAIYHHIINAKGTIDSYKSFDFRFDRGLSLALAMDEVSTRSRPSSACSKKYPVRYYM